MKIALIRKKRLLTQTQLAQACETTQQTIAKIENGIVDPRLSTLQKIADALKCELTDLFFTKKEFVNLINQTIKQKKLDLEKVKILEINSVCAREAKIPPFHPFWKNVTIKNGSIKYKEE